MPQTTESHTTDPSAPTTSEMEAMWLDARRAEQDAEILRTYERQRARIAAMYGEVA